MYISLHEHFSELYCRIWFYCGKPHLTQDFNEYVLSLSSDERIYLKQYVDNVCIKMFKMHSGCANFISKELEKSTSRLYFQQVIFELME